MPDAPNKVSVSGRRETMKKLRALNEKSQQGRQI